VSRRERILAIVVAGLVALFLADRLILSPLDEAKVESQRLAQERMELAAAQEKVARRASLQDALRPYREWMESRSADEAAGAFMNQMLGIFRDAGIQPTSSTPAHEPNGGGFPLARATFEFTCSNEVLWELMHRIEAFGGYLRVESFNVRSEFRPGQAETGARVRVTLVVSTLGGAKG
jgi:hypothetical protein